MANLGRHPRRVLLAIFVVCETLGLCALILHIVVSIFAGGLSLDSEDSPSKIYNLHGICSALAMIIILGNGTMLYRICRDLRLRVVKYMHATIMLIAFVLAMFGLIVAIVARESEAIKPVKHFYSLHAWLGLTCYTVFLFQIITAFPIFIANKVSVSTEDYFAAIHAFCGICLFVLASFTAAMGLSLKSQQFSQDIGFWSWQKIVINFVGLLYIVFKAMVFYIIVNPFFESEQAEEL